MSCASLVGQKALLALADATVGDGPVADEYSCIDLAEGWLERYRSPVARGGLVGFLVDRMVELVFHWWGVRLFRMQMFKILTSKWWASGFHFPISQVIPSGPAADLRGSVPSWWVTSSRLIENVRSSG